MKSRKALSLIGLALILCTVFLGCGSSSKDSPSKDSPSELIIPAGTSLPAGQVSTAYSATLSAIGGIHPYAWSLISGGLPAGLSLNASGAVSGTPTASGTSNFTVQVSDAESIPQRVTAQLSITIAPPPLIITTTSLSTCTINTACAAILTATGGMPPYSWRVTSGTLPPGVSLDTAGSIAGTPTAIGTFSFAAQVADAESTPQTATMQLSITVTTQIQVTTQHNDNSRTGQDLNETILTTSSVNSSQFGKLFSFAVDGDVYAQPLYLLNVTIPGKGVHNVLYVATEHDSVYALDADDSSGINSSPLWQTSFINPAGGITTLSSSDVNCDAIAPEIGITSTPVIDPGTNTIYVLAATKENGSFFHRLHALDITTGAEKFGGPVTIQATYPGTGDGSSHGTLTFDSLKHLNRAGLLMSNGNIYLTWASYCDNDPFHGWVMAYDKTSLQRNGVWVATPNGGDGGIWMTGAGMSADPSGNLFFATGNGSFETSGNPVDFGDSIVKMTLNGNSFNVIDYFTPFDQQYLDVNDLDLGSGGILLLPDQSGSHLHELVQAGKEGSIYVVDRDSMGHFNSTDNSQIVQNITGQIGFLFSSPAYWNNNVFFGGDEDQVKAFSLNAGLLSTAPTSTSPTIIPWPGTSLTISANGTSNAILWGLETNPAAPAVLHAYDATNLAHELYNSSQNQSRDNPGSPVKFAVPTVANGKVYVGAVQQVSAYGIIR
jgi:hypothetical protein